MGNVFVPFNFNPTDTKFLNSTSYTVPANTYAHVKLVAPGGTITLTKSGGSPQTSDIYSGKAVSAAGSYAGGDPSSYTGVAIFTVPTSASLKISTFSVTVADSSLKQGRIRGTTTGTLYLDTGTSGGPVTRSMAAGTIIPGGEALVHDHINVVPPPGGDRSGSYTLSGTYEQLGNSEIEFWLSAGDVLMAYGLVVVNEYPMPS